MQLVACVAECKQGEGKLLVQLALCLGLRSIVEGEQQH
jgi:hypothetical protein